MLYGIKALNKINKQPVNKKYATSADIIFAAVLDYLDFMVSLWIIDQLFASGDFWPVVMFIIAQFEAVKK